MRSGAEIRFAVSENPRLAGGTASQLNHIEISPFGLHWPELDEDLSFQGIAQGDYGQSSGPAQSSVERRGCIEQAAHIIPAAERHVREENDK